MAFPETKPFGEPASKAVSSVCSLFSSATSLSESGSGRVFPQTTRLLRGKLRDGEREIPLPFTDGDGALTANVSTDGEREELLLTSLPGFLEAKHAIPNRENRTRTVAMQAMRLGIPRKAVLLEKRADMASETTQALTNRGGNTRYDPRVLEYLTSRGITDGACHVDTELLRVVMGIRFFLR